MIIEKVESCLQQLEIGNVEEAIERLHQLMQDEQMTDPLRFEISEYLHESGFVNEALDIAECLYERHNQEPEIHVLLAELYIENGKEDNALALLSTIGPSDDHYLQSTLLQSDIYMNQGLYEVAEKKIKEALYAAPDEQVLYTALAEIYYAQEKYQLALHHYNRSQGNVSAARIADCYSHLGQFEDALSYYKQAVQDEDGLDVRFGYAFVAYRLQQWEVAVNQFQRVLEMDEQYVSVYPLLAESLIKVSRDEEAVTVIDKGISMDQTNPLLYTLQGNVHWNTKEYAAATHSWQQALNIDPEYGPALDKLLEATIEEEEWERGLSIVEQLLDLYPERCDYYVRQGRIFEEMEKWPEAIESYQKALQIDANDVDALNRFGFVLRDEGHVQQALSLWERSLTIDANQWEIAELVEREEMTDPPILDDKKV